MKALRNMRIFVFLSFFLLCGTIFPAAAESTERTGTVAAAASLQPLMNKLIPWFNENRGSGLQGVYGSSGNLARQIESGAPFDLFLSADEQWARYAEAKGLLEGEPLAFATMPLVLWHGGKNHPSLDLLKAGKYTVAIADPETAPFGRRAKAYLVEKGLFEVLDKNGGLIIGGDVLKTGLAAMSGGADLAILPLSTAGALGEGAWTLLDTEPQTLFGGIVKGRRTPAVAEFWTFLRSSEAAAFFEEFGFLRPR